MSRLPLLLSSVLLAVAAACGGGSSTGASVPRDLPFDDMTPAQQLQFMKEVVLPETQAMYTAFDATLPPVTCKTCHGAGADDGSFEMPNPDITPLPNSEEAFMAWVAENPDAGRWAKFMSEVLEPKTAALLHKTPFNPADGSGEFSCMACHTLVTAAPIVVPPAETTVPTTTP